MIMPFRDQNTCNSILSGMMFYFISNTQHFFYEKLMTVPDDVDMPHKEDFNNAQQWYWDIPKKTWDIPYQDYNGAAKNHYAYYLNNDRSKNRVALVQHGFTGCARSMGVFVKIFHDIGYSILTPDLRGQGRSDELSTSLAVYDAEDMLLWVDKIIKEKGDDVEIIIYGISLGAMVTLQAASKNKFPDNVKAIIVDSGPYYALDNIKKIMNDYLTFITPNQDDRDTIITDTFSLIKDKLGISQEMILSKEMINECNIPLLQIHGKDDNTFPYQSAIELFDNYKNNDKQYMYTNKSDHAYSIIIDYETYIKCINQFTRRPAASPLISGVLEKTNLEIIVGNQLDLLDGVQAWDSHDGNITAKIEVSGNVDTNIPGNYSVHYSVTNSQNIVSALDTVYTVLDKK